MQSLRSESAQPSASTADLLEPLGEKRAAAVAQPAPPGGGGPGFIVVLIRGPRTGLEEDRGRVSGSSAAAERCRGRPDHVAGWRRCGSANPGDVGRGHRAGCARRWRTRRVTLSASARSTPAKGSHTCGLPDGPHPRGIRAPRRAVAADRERVASARSMRSPSASAISGPELGTYSGLLDRSGTQRGTLQSMLVMKTGAEPDF